jgi:hypothetical protein
VRTFRHETQAYAESALLVTRQPPGLSVVMAGVMVVSSTPPATLL